MGSEKYDHVFFWSSNGEWKYEGNFKKYDYGLFYRWLGSTVLENEKYEDGFFGHPMENENTRMDFEEYG